MSIIVIKKSGGAFPSDATLKRYFKSHSDGAGFAYNENGRVTIVKGLMTLEEFTMRYRECKRKHENSSFVFHFRTATSGGVKKHLCQPFPVTNSECLLSAESIGGTQLAVAHNGIILEPYDEQDRHVPFDSYFLERLEYSGTYLFVRDVIYPHYKRNPLMYMMQQWLNDLHGATESKFAFIDGLGGVYTSGDFTQDKDGCLHSNPSCV